MLTDSMLKAIMPVLPANKRKQYLLWLNLSMARFDINNELRVSMFLAQLAHESLSLTRWVENLNYSAKRMTQVWPSRFPTIASATPFAHNPEALAIKTYGGRMGNRPNTNDGWVYRGRAPLQATGRSMYEALTEAIGEEYGVNFLSNPDALLEPKYGFLASAWIFAVEKNCNPLADNRNIKACTKRINGGYTGLAERIQIWERALRVLPDNFRLEDYDELLSQAQDAPSVPVAVVSNIEEDPDTPDIDLPVEIEPEPVPVPNASSAVPKETELSGAADDSTPTNSELSPQYVNKERPSLFSRVMTAIFTFIATAIASITATCGGNEVVNLLAKQGAERVVENAERSDLATFGLVVAYIAVGLGAAVLLFYIASKIYEKSAERANRLNQVKVVAASDKDKNTVEFKQ